MRTVIWLIIVVLETTIILIQNICLMNFLQLNNIFIRNHVPSNNREDVILVYSIIFTMIIYFNLNLLYVRSKKHFFIILILYFIAINVAAFKEDLSHNFINFTLFYLIVIPIETIPFIIIYSFRDMRYIRKILH
jgi:hypothetical protein